MKMFWYPALPALLLLLPAAALADGPATTIPTHWTAQNSGVGARLRGISAVDDQVVWASGASNSVLRSDDGGAHWQKLVVAESASTATPAAPPAATPSPPLDFRDIDAVDRNTAYLLSIGPGTASRIYKTTNAGGSWDLQYQNQDPQGFLDSMTFWDANSGLVIGDAIDGHLQILITENGGATWNKIPDAVLPPALPNEGAFSASGSNIAMVGDQDAWIGTGAITKSRLLHTGDRGKTWTVVDTPIASSESAGIFSVAFRDRLHGVIVGGDYKAESAAVDNVAITSDGGKTWQLIRAHGLSGYRSAVKYLPDHPGAVLAVGPSGADLSWDDGRTWQPVNTSAVTGGFDALSVAPHGRVAWVSGDKGHIARIGFN